MTFWQENYAFIKEVYDMRHTKMAEWMENVEKVLFFLHSISFFNFQVFSFILYLNSFILIPLTISNSGNFSHHG